MRRTLAYLFLGASLLLGVGATITSSLSKMDTDVSYGSGKDLYFRISDKGSTYEGVSTDTYVEDDNYYAVNEVAKEIESRLEFWDINATVAKEGYSTIKVSVRTQGSDEVEYSYLQTYLAYSGQHVTVEAGTTDEDAMTEAPNSVDFADNGLFEEGTNAEITYVNTVPVVTVPVKEAFQGENGKLNELIKFCTDHTVQEEKDDEGNVTTPGKSCLLVLWHHKQEADSYAAVQNKGTEDYTPNMASRLLFGEDATNAWYVDQADSDNNYKKLQLIPSSAAIKDGSYDASKANAAYKAAKFYRDILNAKEYNYDVTFAYSSVVTAGVDPLTRAGDWHLSINFGPSAIASLVALVIGIVIISVFYRFGAVAILGNAAVAVEAAILLFAYFSAQFGIGALAGFGLGAIVTAFGGIYYFHKVKQQLYEGRTLKKAHQEASKKALWPTLDISIISIVIGVCLYGFVHSTIGNLGLALTLTSAFGLVLNLILLRIEGWLLANDQDSEKHLKAFFGVDPTKVPNALKDEKQSYYGALANKDFEKHKKPFMIGALALIIAAIAGVSIMSATIGAFNYSGAYDNTTSINVEYWINSESFSTKKLADKQQVMDDFLSLIEYDNQSIGKLTTEEDITLETRQVYLNEDEITYTVYNFEIPLSVYFDEKDSSKTFTVNGTAFNSLNQAVKEAVDTFTADNSVYASANTVFYQAGTPNLGTVYLGIGVGVAIAFVYLIFRFGLARAFVSSVISLGSSVLTVGFFALTRLPVTPLASIGAALAGLAALYVALFTLNRAKEIVKDSRERDKSALEFKNNCLVKANAEEAVEIIVFSSIMAALCLALAIIGPREYAVIFVGALLGLAFSVAATLFTLVPASKFLSVYIKRASDSVAASHKKAQEERRANEKNNRRKGSEPEEAIFIGIND